jgi:hypothetical protein
MASPLMNVGPVTGSEREEEPKGILPGSRKVVMYTCLQQYIAEFLDNRLTSE